MPAHSAGHTSERGGCGKHAAPWLAHYPPGVPAEADVAAYSNLLDLLGDAFRRHARRDASCCMETRTTFGQVDTLSQALAAWLQSLDLTHGARVAVMLPSVPQYLVAIAGILRAGFVVVNVNPLYTPRELAHQLCDSGAEAIIVLENFAHTVAQTLPQCPDVRHVVLASKGDMLGFWRSRLINFAVRHAKKLVPEFSLPQSGGNTVSLFNEVLTAGDRLPFKRPSV